MKNKLYPNGFFIQKETGSKFRGLTDDIWPIDLETPMLESNLKKQLYDYCEANITRSWEDENIVEVCNDIKFLDQYILACESSNIKIRILFCFSEKTVPIFDIDNNKLHKSFVCLGYDYAYPGGSFYSCVLNDVFSRRIRQFDRFALNQYGLFENKESLTDFIDFRSNLSKKSSMTLFEQGDFTVYQLWEYSGNLSYTV